MMNYDPMTGERLTPEAQPQPGNEAGQAPAGNAGSAAQPQGAYAGARFTQPAGMQGSALPGGAQQGTYRQPDGPQAEGMPAPQGAYQQPVYAAPVREPMSEEEKKGLRGLVLPAAIFAIVSLVCLYHNGRGIAVAVWAAAAVILLLQAARVQGRKAGGWSLFWLAGIAVLAVGNVLTNRTFVVRTSWLGIGILMTLYVRDLWQDMGIFRPVRALGELIVTWFQGVSAVPVPFRLTDRHAEGRKKVPWRNVGIVLASIFVCIPVLWLVILMLGEADEIFHRVTLWVLRIPEWLHLDERILIYALWLIAGFYIFFGLSYAARRRAQTPVRIKEPHADPLPATVGLVMFSVVYGVFCVIQILYLFAGGRLGLPEGVTYASYAREGFFQLLFVAVLNLFAVLLVTGVFRPSRAVRILLTFLCGCTYVMIASAAMRMILYVQAYDLSFDRLLVLWFLPCLTVLVTGALISIYRPTFKLMRFFTVTMLIGWMVFAFMKPDAMIARYNLSSGRTEIDHSYWSRNLSTDAAPVIAEHIDEVPAEYLAYYTDRIERAYEQSDVRTFNVSLWRAHRLLGPDAQSSGR